MKIYKLVLPILGGGLLLFDSVHAQGASGMNCSRSSAYTYVCSDNQHSENAAWNPYDWSMSQPAFGRFEPVGSSIDFPFVRFICDRNPAGAIRREEEFFGQTYYRYERIGSIILIHPRQPYTLEVPGIIGDNTRHVDVVTCERRQTLYAGGGWIIGGFPRPSSQMIACLLDIPDTYSGLQRLQAVRDCEYLFGW